MTPIVIAPVDLDCPHCGTRMKFYESAQSYYCPKKAGGCGAYGTQGRVYGKYQEHPCAVCGKTITTRSNYCRSCKTWIGGCQQCDVTWKHSHVVTRTCQHPSCGREYVTRKHSTPDREKRYCSDRCNRNMARLKYGQRQRTSRSKSKMARERKGRVTHDRVTLELLVAQEYRCSYCHELVDLTLPWNDAMALTADHTIPLADGGSDDPSNLTAMHRACNSRKGWRSSDSHCESVA